MTYQNIAFVGKARSGKDTAAQCLVRRHLFTRVAFADPLKRMALDLDPYIPTGYGVTVRLSALIADVGWEYAKDNYPEVRRVLQYAGQTVREHNPDFWVDIAHAKIKTADTWGLPVVVTDCRYPNEFEMLRRLGFLMVRIQRPGGRGAMTMGQIRAAMHASENELNDYPADVTLINGGTLANLETETDALLRKR